jgi:PAS domain S-box-containing protein
MYKLIRRLNVTLKLTLVSIAFLIPDFVLMCLYLVTINGYIDFAQQELNGNKYLRPLEELLDHLPLHLQLARRSAAGDAHSTEQLAQAQASVDAALGQLAAVDALLGDSLQFTTQGLAQRHREQCHASAVAEEWHNLKKQLNDLGEADCEAAHLRLIANIRAMIGHAGDTSNLILDPDLDSCYLMDVTLLALPQMQDRLGAVLLRADTCLRRGALTAAHRGQFKVDVAMLKEADLDRILASARTALNEDQNFYGTSDSLQRRLPAALDQFATATNSFIKLTDRLADSTTPDFGPDDFLAAANTARRASFDLWHVAAEELDGLLLTRIGHFKARRASSLLLAALAFAAAITLVTFITRSISRPLLLQADELRQAIEAMQQSERRACAIIEAAPNCVITMNQDGKIVEFNQAAEKIFGHQRDAAIGRDAAELIVPDRYRQAHRQGLERYLQTGEGPALGRRLELAGLRADGCEFPIEIAISVVNRAGAPTFIAFITDITQRKESEDVLRRMYAETQMLLASIASVLIHLDSSGVITRWNAAAESAFGLPAADAIGRSCRDLCWANPQIAARLKHLAACNGSEQFHDVTITHSDGIERVLDLTAIPICADGQCSGLLVHGSNRTQQVQLERSLRQAQKLESIGQLAAGIAHEINTPMQFVCDNIEYLSECSEKLFEVVDHYQANLDSGGQEKSWEARRLDLQEVIERNKFRTIREQVPLAIAESLEGAHRVINIVLAMKEFSHQGREGRVAVDLNNAVRSTIVISRNRWKYCADLETELDPNLPAIHCLPAEINQVLLNLIVNAADAVAEKVGENADPKGIILVRTAANEQAVIVEVTDSGCGIPDDIRGRIFDPFFTTKEVGKGTGQGLAICYNVVVNKHQGAIEVDSEPGVGTTFRVTLPLTGSGPADSGADVVTSNTLLETTTV